MSAPAFAISVAPFMGPAAAPKRGAATTDADFAAVLDEATPVEPPVKPAPSNGRGKADAAPPSVEAAPEVTVEDAPAADETLVAVPAPLTAAAPPVVVEAEVAVAQTAPAPIADEPAQPALDPNLVASANDDDLAAKGAPTPGARAEASLDARPQGAAAEVKAEADLAELTARLAEQPKTAPAPPPAALAVAAPPPAPRQAKAADDTAAMAEVTADEAPVSGEAAPLEAPVAPGETPRIRDVIDRAVTNRPEAQGTFKEDAAAAPPSEGAESAAPTMTATPQTPAAPPTVAAEPAVLTLQIADEAAVTAPVATAGQPVEARAADPALSLALSTISHASIETTAQIAAQIVKKLEGRSVRFEMALTPEGLGNVDVSLDIDADGKLVARMAFDNPLAATEMRGRVDELRRQLQDSGFTVADDALTFAERDASAGQHGGSAFDNRPDPRGARAFGAGARLSAEADIAVPGRWIPLSLTPDRVDMKV